MRQNERQPWSAPPADEIVVMPNSGGLERIWGPHREGGHFVAPTTGCATSCSRGANDPLNRRTGKLGADGAASLLALLRRAAPTPANRALPSTHCESSQPAALIQKPSPTRDAWGRG